MDPRYCEHGSYGMTGAEAMMALSPGSNWHELSSRRATALAMARTHDAAGALAAADRLDRFDPVAAGAGGWPERQWVVLGQRCARRLAGHRGCEPGSGVASVPWPSFRSWPGP